MFTTGFDTWWPREFTWSGDVLERIAIEPWEGGRCFERGPNGFAIDWERVLVWEPPRRLVITWQISPGREPVPDPAKASEIEVKFEAREDHETHVVLEHRNFSRHGKGSDDYREALETQGWPYILDSYSAALSDGQD